MPAGSRRNRLLLTCLVLGLLAVSLLVLFPLLKSESPQMSNTSNAEDSLCDVRCEQAIEDFHSGSFHVRNSFPEGRDRYVEEIFFTWYGIKPEVTSGLWICGTGRTHMDDLYTECYEHVMDSMIRSTYGGDIFDRVERAADSLKNLFPNRYASLDTLFGGYAFPEDSLHAILMRSVHYPPAARRDSIEGTVYVQLHFDSVGVVKSTSVIRGLRADIDSAAQVGFADIEKVRPGFRWGHPQSGELTVPIKFALKD